MIRTTFIMLSICFSTLSSAKDYIVTKRNLSVKVSFDISKNYEVRKKFLNTPLLIWNKSLKHQGPSIGLFPLDKLPKGVFSRKGLHTNFSKFKKDKERNLATLKVKDIVFEEPNLDKDRITYRYTYNLPGKIKIYSTEVLMLCSGKGLRIKSVVKSTDYKAFKPFIDSFFTTVSCKKS